MNMRTCGWCLLLSCLAGADTGDDVMNDGTIRTAVAAWLSNPTAAEATYGHISTWDTSGVRNMNYLFCASSGLSSCNTAAASFNEDISAWDTSGVTTMRYAFYGAKSFNQDIGGWAVHSVMAMNSMFEGASAFNQDIGAWAVHSVTTMGWMFTYAYAFDQDLGWCVADVYLGSAFGSTQCSSTSCGVMQGICDYPMTDSIIRTAVAAWLTNPTAAEASYGHISTWATGGVTDMTYFFCAASGLSSCNTAAASFNEDISAWDTSGVTTMYAMFSGALAFDQDLGWCVADDVNLGAAFHNTPCASTSCGVHSRCYMTNSTIRTAVAAWLADATAAEASYGHISTWETSEVTDMTYLFCAQYCGSATNSAAASFNEDIGAWDTSGVTTMRRMFYYASAFDQDLGWCVHDGVNLSNAFYNTPCSSTSCGVVRCPTKENDKEQTPVAVIAGVTVAALLLAVGAFYYYRRLKGPEPEPKKGAEATPPKAEAATAVAPEAEESPQEAEESPQEILAEKASPAPPARGWFRRAEPVTKPEEAEEAGAEEPPSPPARSWSWRAETEPEAEEAERPPPSAKGWFTAAVEPEGEAEAPPFAPETEERPPPPGNWFSRAAPEPEPEFEPEPEA